MSFHHGVPVLSLSDRARGSDFWGEHGVRFGTKIQFVWFFFWFFFKSLLPKAKSNNLKESKIFPHWNNSVKENKTQISEIWTKCKTRTAFEMSFVNICCRVFCLYTVYISGRKEVLLCSFTIPCHLYLLHMNKHTWVLFCDVWWVSLSVPAWAERGEQTWSLQIKPHILWCPTVQVRRPVVFRHA